MNQANIDREIALQSLRSIVLAIHPLPVDAWEEFADIWQPFFVKRKTQLSVPGQIERFVYFVVDGVQRVYYFDDHGREATIVFTYPPSFAGVLDAMILQTPSKYFFETLTPSLFLRAPMVEFLRLCEKHHALESMLRKGLASAMSGVLERLVEIQCLSTEERFRNLLSRSPHILQLVAHKYLASYLAMDATNFSKLINKVRV